MEQLHTDRAREEADAHRCDAPGISDASCPLPSPPRARRRLTGYFMNLLALRCTAVPLASLGKPALVFSSHPDDECLGCGGTILRKKQAGATVKIVHMTDGSRSHPARLISHQQLSSIRAAEARDAAEALGADEVYFLNFRDQALSASVAPAIERVAEIIREEKPEDIFVPYSREPIGLAADHVVTTSIVLSALRSYQASDRVIVWEYPVWFWIHWPWVGAGKGLIPRRTVAVNSLRHSFGLRAFWELRHTVDISDILPRKIAALCQHRTQMTKFLPKAEWTTLPDILGGQFLECFYSGHEFFRCSLYRRHG